MQPDASVIKLNTSLIVPNKYQPRKIFDEKALNSLAESIKTYGIINPILVRKKDDKYEIIAGERRFRAAIKIGLTEVPVIVKNADEQQMAELALIENIQRQALNPIEEAKSYEEIIRIGNQTQSSLAEKLGKSQSSIANKIRLLSLPQEIQNAVANKQISERHARSLITVEEKERQLELLNRIIDEKLTVKETELIINEKEINEAEIKQAISDIMKSLNIKEEEKEDDNMNNGNFFPNFDNNNAANNNASLNMMNMQSINQQPMAPEPEMVMPTMVQPNEPQLVVPTAPVEPSVVPAGPELPQKPAPEPSLVVPTMGATVDMNNTLSPMGGFSLPQDNLSVAPAPTMEAPMINEVPLFGPTLMQPEPPAAPAIPELPQMSVPVVDEPLFNPSVTMPNTEPTLVVPTPSVVQPETPMEAPVMPVPSFEVPVTAPTLEIPVPTNKLVDLQNLLTTNGYTYKTYSNETDNCIIIELPKN